MKKKIFFVVAFLLWELGGGVFSACQPTQPFEMIFQSPPVFSLIDLDDGSLSIKLVQPKGDASLPIEVKSDFTTGRTLSQLPCIWPKEGVSLPFQPFLHFTLKTSLGVFVGRYLLRDACTSLKATIYMMEENSFIELNSFWGKGQLYELKAPLEMEDLQRAGHTVTKLPDGRYFIVGGMKMLPSSLGNGLQSLFASKDESSSTGLKLKDFNITTIIYDPKTHTPSKGPDLSFGIAFHSAIAMEDRVVLIGGVRVASKGSKYSGMIVFPYDAKSKILAEPHLIPKNDYPRAFAKVVELSKNEKRSFIPLGGYSFQERSLCQQKSSNPCPPLQLAFHTATYLPTRHSIILLGGILYDRQGKFRMNPYGWEISEKELQSGQISLSRDKAFLLPEPRAGHVAVALPDGKLFVYGGFVIPSKSSSPFNIHKIYKTALLVSPPDSDKQKWTFAPLKEEFEPRMLATATLLFDGRIVVNGGIRSFERPDKGKLSFSLNGEALLITPSSSSSGWKGMILSHGTERFWHTTTLLETGQLLVVGGISNEGNSELVEATESFELFTSSFPQK